MKIFITLLVLLRFHCSVAANSGLKRGLKFKEEFVGNEKISSGLPKILMFITTHMSWQHKEHLKHCWPLALKNSYLLNSSDINVFMTPIPNEIPESISIVKDTFKGMNYTYHIQRNQGYHDGASAAMEEGIKNDWFKGYDWVFRLNADVIIQDDTWMLDIIKYDDDASLLYIECLPHLLPHRRKIHTDFFAVKISDLDEKELFKVDSMAATLGAEDRFTYQMRPILMFGKHRHVPNAYPLFNVNCRVNGNLDGPVFHFQDDYGMIPHIEGGRCPARFNNLE